MIAQALACEPKLLVADEPTTALDVTVQGEILKLMRDLRERVNAGVVLITHDMGVVADMADRIVVMQQGRIVEAGTADQIFNHAATSLHPAAAGGGAALRCGERCRRMEERTAREQATRCSRDSRADHGGGEPRPRVPQARQPACVPGGRRRVADHRTRRGRRSGRASPGPARRRSGAPRSGCCRSPAAGSTWRACRCPAPPPRTCARSATGWASSSRTRGPP